ncbi:hypothetical protein, partial [Vibrio antiquarius]|uniref:hypothetical protein n=1 Tax=Vibrio antiquarius (strain Ex25) TaxID=150340 RepID=UPI00265A7C30
PRVPGYLSRPRTPPRCKLLFVKAYASLACLLSCDAFAAGFEWPPDELAQIVYSFVIDGRKVGSSLVRLGFTLFNLNARSRLCLGLLSELPLI